MFPFCRTNDIHKCMWNRIGFLFVDFYLQLKIIISKCEVLNITTKLLWRTCVIQKPAARRSFIKLLKMTSLFNAWHWTASFTFNPSAWADGPEFSYIFIQVWYITLYSYRNYIQLIKSTDGRLGPSFSLGHFFLHFFLNCFILTLYGISN